MTDMSNGVLRDCGEKFSIRSYQVLERADNISSVGELSASWFPREAQYIKYIREL